MFGRQAYTRDSAALSASPGQEAQSDARAAFLPVDFDSGGVLIGGGLYAALWHLLARPEPEGAPVEKNRVSMENSDGR